MVGDMHELAAMIGMENDGTVREGQVWRERDGTEWTLTDVAPPFVFAVKANGGTLSTNVAMLRERYTRVV
jgi:hypothetical protein